MRKGGAKVVGEGGRGGYRAKWDTFAKKAITLVKM